MKKLKNIFLLSIATISLNACVMISSTSMSNPGPAGTTVTASASDIGFLMLTVPSASGLERNAMNQLRDGGATKNITSRLVMRDFFGIIQVYKVEASGDK